MKILAAETVGSLAKRCLNMYARLDTHIIRETSKANIKNFEDLLSANGNKI